MSNKKITDVRDLLALMDLVFSNMNLGLLVYEMEHPKDERKLKLVYANAEASRYTGTDLQNKVGKYVLDAFPALAGTELPKAYLEIASRKEARTIGLVEYADETMQKKAYSVKGFPLPANCLGIIFEDVQVRKQLNEVLKHQIGNLQSEYDKLAARVSAISGELGEILSASETLKNEVSSSLANPHLSALTAIIARLKRLTEQI